MDNTTKEIKGVGKAVNGLYYLVDHTADDPLTWSLNTCMTADSKADDTSLSHVVPDTSNSSELWHHRLGHDPLDKIKLISSLKLAVQQSNKVCVTCPMSKFTKMPFTLSTSHAHTIFDLVHINIWGPYKECIMNKYRYFMTIVDDHSRYTWVYLLQYKSDALQTIKTFVNYVHNHFNKKVKTIRSDNALEFTTAECHSFFSDLCIVYRTPCVQRPQQNSRVERKHRHILEIARCLRFHASMPLKFWGDCVMTAVHIMNKLPTVVLSNKTPHECYTKLHPSMTI